MVAKKVYKSTHGITSQIMPNGKRTKFKIGEEIPEKCIGKADTKRYLAAGILTEVVVDVKTD